MNIPSISNMRFVPEEYVRHAAMVEYPHNRDNTFIRLLDVAAEFRMADLTPLFYYIEDSSSLMVTTREKIQNKFH